MTRPPLPPRREGRPPGPRPLALLHTAAAHIATFDALAAALAPEVPLRHAVAPELLAEAMAAGGVSPDLAARLRARLLDEAATAGAVLCTCSTLGPAAEAANDGSPAPILRLDRAMAERAAAAGDTVLVVACLASTLEPTTALLAEAAAAAGRRVALRSLLLAEAWPLFQSGDRAGFQAAIAAAARREAGDADCIVLAQASMAPAADLLADLGRPVLASPRLGFLAAVAAWRAAIL
ncbi:MAG TPA: aspartate/glutamate racemase family protein [Alphaproteobacteria bacterium]|nr:aspartate/glutamate racemase family protein [Alphaproteobacteria bacterium]